MVDDMEVSKENMHIAAQKGFSTATDIADWLVKNLNIPFRDAHHVTGRCVRLAEEKNCRLDELSIEELQEIDSRISNDIFNVLSVENSVKSRKSFGGTSWDNY